MQLPENYGQKFAAATRLVTDITQDQATELVTRHAPDTWSKRAAKEGTVKLAGCFLIRIDRMYDWPVAALTLTREGSPSTARTAMLYVDPLREGPLVWKMQVFGTDKLPKRELSPPPCLPRLD